MTHLFIILIGVISERSLNNRAVYWLSMANSSTHDRTNCNKLKPFFWDYIHMLPQIYFKTEWEVKPKWYCVSLLNESHLSEILGERQVKGKGIYKYVIGECLSGTVWKGSQWRRHFHCLTQTMNAYVVTKCTWFHDANTHTLKNCSRRLPTIGHGVGPCIPYLFRVVKWR